MIIAVNHYLPADLPGAGNDKTGASALAGKRAVYWALPAIQQDFNFLQQICCKFRELRPFSLGKGDVRGNSLFLEPLHNIRQAVAR